MPNTQFIRFIQWNYENYEYLFPAVADILRDSCLQRFEAEPLAETKYRAAPPRLSHCGAINSGNTYLVLAIWILLLLITLPHIEVLHHCFILSHHRRQILLNTNKHRPVQPLCKCIRPTYANWSDMLSTEIRLQYQKSRTENSLVIFDQAKVGVWTPFPGSTTAMSVHLINSDSTITSPTQTHTLQSNE